MTLKADQADALLVSNPTNVRYLTGFTGEDSALIVTRDRAVIVSDGRFTTQLRQECPDLEAAIRPIDQTQPEFLAGVVGKLGVRRLAFEGAALSVADCETLREKLPAVALHGRRRPGRGAPGDQGQGRSRRDPRGDRVRRAGLHDAPSGSPPR